MSVRTTNTDPVGFIYDSVTGMSIGECWEDTEQMERFLEWWNENHNVDLRSLNYTALCEAREEFIQNHE